MRWEREKPAMCPFPPRALSLAWAWWWRGDLLYSWVQFVLTLAHPNTRTATVFGSDFRLSVICGPARDFPQEWGDISPSEEFPGLVGNNTRVYFYHTS